MVINSMTMNSNSSSGMSNTNININANSSGSSDAVFNNMMMMSLSIDNGEGGVDHGGEAKNSIATFDANALYDGSSTSNEGMYDDGSKDMYLKFLLNKDQNRGSKVGR